MFLYKECVKVPPLGMIDDLASFSECGIESLKTNAIVNSKIESKKLEFGPSKCVKIHIGKTTDSCLEQKVHGDKISENSFEAYLGDIVCASGSNDKNIESRSNRGVGAVSQITTMMKRVSLGHYHFEIGLVFRDTVLVSKMVFNSEIWYNVTEKQIRKLEQIDEMFFRKLFNLPGSAPRVGMHAECGKIPIRHLIKMRRIMYFWHIMHTDKNELLQRFLSAQELSSSPRDWIIQVRKDMLELKLDLSDEQICKMSKDIFSKYVKRKIEENAVKYLKENSGSKTSNLQFKTISREEYLTSKELSIEQVQTLYKLRNRMINIKENNKSSYTENSWCRTCFLFRETQSHLLQCPPIREKLRFMVDFKSMKYDMIFRSLAKQVKIAKAYALIVQTRKDMIEDMTK